MLKEWEPKAEHKVKVNWSKVKWRTVAWHGLDEAQWIVLNKIGVEQLTTGAYVPTYITYMCASVSSLCALWL